MARNAPTAKITCIRVIDMVPGVNYADWKREPCAECKAMVIISLPGVIFQKEHPGSVFICMQCAILSGQAPIGSVPGALDLVEELAGPEAAARAAELQVQIGDLITEAGRQGRERDLAAAYDEAYGSQRGRRRSARRPT